MKKVLAMLLTLVLMFSLCACGDKNRNSEEPTSATQITEEEKTVTVYIPKTFTNTYMSAPIIDPVPIPMSFEEGWENKDSFSVSYINSDNDMASRKIVTYIEGKSVYEEKNQKGIMTKRLENFVDEKGNFVCVYYASEMRKREETTVTVDARMRVIQEEIKYFDADAKVKKTDTWIYTYKDTLEGSEGIANKGNEQMILSYNKDDRLVSTTFFINGEERLYDEYTYDEFGNNLTHTTYYSYTNDHNYYLYRMMSRSDSFAYKAVQVSAEKAKKMPRFSLNPEDTKTYVRSDAISK